MTFLLNNSKLDNILFIDIETVSAFPTYKDLDEDWQYLWEKKAKQLLSYKNEVPDGNKTAEMYVDRAGIYAEFGKIICITVAYLKRASEDSYELRMKSFYGDDEKTLLNEFGKMIDRHFDKPSRYFICGHNIREFDVPYIGRRFLVNGLNLPEIFNLIGKKPWESKHLLDTLEMWKFGDYKNYISLELLAKILNVPSPKVEMDGSMVGHAYWVENRLEDIKKYCELDVRTSVNVFLKLNGSRIQIVE